MEQDVILQESPAPEISPEEGAPDTSMEKYLLFLSDGLLFGVTADHVLEIITNHTITQVPLLPDYIRGIINLRGQIIPIVDIRLLLGQPRKEDTCIMILELEDSSFGILVDAVQRMLDVKKDSITSVPTQNSQKLVSGMCALPDGQTMLVFDCAQLTNRV